MIYECTDCRHCVRFHVGWRLFCLHPDLPPDSVCDYHPLGDGDAWDCKGFDDSGYPQLFSMKKLLEAEAYSQEKHDEVSYVGIREWCEKAISEREQQSDSRPAVLGAPNDPLQL